MFQTLLPSFSDELNKLSEVHTTAGSAVWEKTAARGGKRKQTSHHEKVTRFLKSRKKDWAGFEKNLDSPEFHKAVTSHPKSDSKLKKFVTSIRDYRDGSEVAKVKGSSGTYSIRKMESGRLGCDCNDWKYKKSLEGGNCKHINHHLSSFSKQSSIVSPILAPIHWTANQIGGAQDEIAAIGQDLNLMRESVHPRSWLPSYAESEVMRENMRRLRNFEPLLDMPKLHPLKKALVSAALPG